MKHKVMIAVSILMAGFLAVPRTRGSDSPSAPGKPTFSHPLEINHPYLQFARLKQDVLVGEDERVERTRKPEIKKSFQIDGKTVEALTVEDREFEDGELVEITLDYFAQDDAGNVYYLGEDVDEYEDGKVSGHSGAWLFGKDTQTMGMLLPTNPKVGDKFRSEEVPNETQEDDEVVSIFETYKTPAGTFHDCIKVREKLSDGTTEFKIYAKAVGCIAEIESDGVLKLKSHSTN